MIEDLRPERVGEVRKPLEQASWLPRGLYVDPAVYEAEVERIFKREWLYAAHVSAVPKRGDFTTVTLLEQPLLVVRGEDGEVRCFYNVCRHRGMALAEGSGHATALRCPYHAWAYDTKGQLFEAPMMDRTAGFDLCAIKLREVRAEIFHGLIFINFDPQAAPLGPALVGLGDMIAPWRVAELTPAGEDDFTGDFNWKVMVENAIEGYHILAVHRDSAGESAPAELSYSTDPGGRGWHDLYTPYTTPLDVKTSGQGIPNLPDWAQTRGTFLSIHPQFMITLNPGSVGIVSIQPLGHGRTRFASMLYAPKDRTHTQGSLAGFMEWAKVINHEDEQVCVGVQKGMRSDAWASPRYSHLEKSVWQFHNWYLDRMTASPPSEPATSAD